MAASMGALRGAAIATAAAACAAALASGCGDSGEATEPIAAADPVKAFAPLINHHSGERVYPLSTERFLRNSTLEWTIGECIQEKNVAAGPMSQRKTGEGAPRLDPRRLGGRLAPAYRHRPINPDCRGRRAEEFATNDHTSPYDAANRESDTVLEEGFFLDLLTRAHRGERKSLTQRDGQAEIAGVPVYTERRDMPVEGAPGTVISYWMLYGSSVSLERDRTAISSHEGDWERVDVLAQDAGRGRYRPVAVRYHVGSGDQVKSGKPLTVPWSDVEKVAEPGGEATHPVVYAARLSHVPYPTAGDHTRQAPSSYLNGELRPAYDTTEACARCPQWRTWELLREAQRQPWYGFGGGWGVRSSADDASGQPGPSPYTQVDGDPNAPLPGPPPGAGIGGVGATVETADPATRFAPQVNLHPEEEWLPADPGKLVASSVLKWANPPGCPPENAAYGADAPDAKGPGHDPLEPRRLGGRPPYTRAIDAPDCDPPPDPGVFRSTQLTRPYTPGRPSGLPPAQGFFLDLDEAGREGAQAAKRAGRATIGGVPVYVEQRREPTDVPTEGGAGVRLTYWLPFGYNEPRDTRGPVRRLSHEGDWERVSVLLRRAGPNHYIPVSVRYELAGSENEDIPWSASKRAFAPGEREETHPIVYIARGSHTPLWRAGRYAGVDGDPALIDEGGACGTCPLWQTWQLVRPVESEPWYGFGGAWGATGRDSATTGPLGPGAPGNQRR